LAHSASAVSPLIFWAPGSKILTGHPTIGDGFFLVLERSPVALHHQFDMGAIRLMVDLAVRTPDKPTLWFGIRRSQAHGLCHDRLVDSDRVCLGPRMSCRRRV